MSEAMVERDHKLFSTPVSVSDGLRRADRQTWKVLGIAAIISLVIVAALALFVEKPKIKWPDTRPTGAPAAAPEEPKTYEVAPPQTPPRQEGG